MLRPEVWPFLLHYYPFDSTFEEREQIRNDKYIEYHNIRKMRLVYLIGAAMGNTNCQVNICSYVSGDFYFMTGSDG